MCGSTRRSASSRWPRATTRTATRRCTGTRSGSRPLDTFYSESSWSARAWSCAARCAAPRSAPTDTSTVCMLRRPAPTAASLDNFTRACAVAPILPMTVCLCLCLSQVGVPSKRLDGSSWLPSIYLVYKNKGTFVTKLELNSRLWKFRHACHVDRLVDKAGRLARWTVVGQLSWQYLRRSTASLSHRSSICNYSTTPSRGFICDVRLILVVGRGYIGLWLTRLINPCMLTLMLTPFVYAPKT